MYVDVVTKLICLDEVMNPLWQQCYNTDNTDNIITNVVLY